MRQGPPDFQHCGEGHREDLPLSLLIKIAAHKHDFLVRERLEAVGITRGAGPLITEIGKNQGLSQSDLAKKMNFRASTISVGIQQLIDAGLVTRTADKNDARQVRLYLSESGTDMFVKIRETFVGLEESLIKDLSSEEAKQLKSILIKLIDSEEENQ